MCGLQLIDHVSLLFSGRLSDDLHLLIGVLYLGGDFPPSFRAVLALSSSQVDNSTGQRDHCNSTRGQRAVATGADLNNIAVKLSITSLSSETAVKRV
jgi:hypothetical protein